MSIALPARAKLNLDLAVLGRRPDGFHEVRTTLQAIDLHDLVSFAPAQTTTLTTTGLPTNVADPKQNSVLKALAALEQAEGRPLPTHIHLHKQIPPGSGMGGASSDAATALRALAVLHQTTADLTAIARTLGSDVPFFLVGGTAIAGQKGDHLTPTPTHPQWFAIAWPGVELPTPDVYRAWDDLEAAHRTQAASPNHLTEAAMSIEPRLREFANALNSRQVGWQMTGSGSAFFLPCAGEPAAQKTAAGLKSLNCWTAIAHTVGSWT